ncbi:MAG TPA: hypothetical protein VF138_05220 [Caulobacteraceae bacterium]
MNLLLAGRAVAAGLTEGRYTSWLWSVWLIDWLMIGLLISFVGLCLYLWRVEVTPVRWRRGDARALELRKIRRDRAIGLYGVFVVIVGAFVAYSAFRNQLKLSAEVELNQEGSGLLDYEMADENIRCLYDNYGHYDSDHCLRVNASSSDHWSKAIFYVEETWFQLEKATRERAKWGSDYAEEVKYWAEDLGRDPTGLFSYYLVSSAPSVADAREEMRLAGVCIPDLCERYSYVLQALPQGSRDGQRALACLTPQDVFDGRSECEPIR